YQLADLAQIAFLVEVLQPGTHGDAFAGNLFAASVDGREQQLQQPVALPGRDVGDHSEVEDRQPSVRGDQQIAGMRVGVDLAVDERLVKVAAHQCFGQSSHRLLGAAHAADLGDLGPGDQIHGQHARAGQVPHRSRHQQFRIALEVPGEAVEVLRLRAV